MTDHRAPVTVFIALGANLQNPQQQIQRGIELLSAIPDSRLVAVSSLYRTAPFGVGDAQPDYINAVAQLETTLPGGSLLDFLQSIESQQGRRRHRDNPLAARTLDLDLLLYGDAVIDTPRLTVPHPRMHERAFVLAPLLEIAPAAIIPGRGKAADFLPAVDGQRIEKLA
jgi:2-amino-4-hydroxy-6-hydroxymethyldihydropteridine diphosphokinase